MSDNKELIERAQEYVENNVGDWTYFSDSSKAWYFANFAELETARLAAKVERLRNALSVISGMEVYLGGENPSPEFMRDFYLAKLKRAIGYAKEALSPTNDGDMGEK